jgi:hypothetical protein
MQKVIRQWDGVAGVSLILIVFLSAYSLELTYWTYNLNRVTVLAFLGLIIGLSIGLSSFSERTSQFLFWLYGIALLFLQLVISVDSAPLWLDRVNSYLLRFKTSIDQLIRNIPLEDGILFLTLAGFLFCFISMNLGYKFLRQKNSWISFSATVFFYYLIQFYLPAAIRNYLFISIFSLLVIVYLGRQYYLTRKKVWDSKEIKADRETSAYFTKYILIFTFILVLFSLGIPQVVMKISENKAGSSAFQRTQEYSTSWGALRNFFYPLRQQSGFGEGYLPEILALGNSRSLKDDEAFIVKAPDGFAYPNRYYWKGRSYDFYENGLWQSKEAEIEHYSSIDINPFPAHSTSAGIFTFLYKYPREIIFTPQIALKVDRESDLIYFPISGKSRDVQSIVDNQLVHKDEQIDVLGAFYVPDWQLLLNSSENYPEWVSSRYLQLPPDFSIKISSLAFDLSSEEDTRIEKALAITNYLRSTFRYKDFVDIPQGADPIEWFLFEGREGFCNYFATADVLMLRSIGIPARMVVGYAQGERISEKDEFVVRIKDSHSWVEAFFPESGWITLEPTPSQPGVILEAQAIAREDFGREEALTLENADLEQDPESGFFSKVNEKYEIIDQVNQPEIAPKKNIFEAALVLFLMVGLIFIIYISFFRKRPVILPIILENRIIQNGKTAPDWLKRWADYEKLPWHQKAYRKLQALSGILLFQVDKNLTPKEFIGALNKNFEVNEKSGKLFLDLYQKSTYGDMNDISADIYFENYKKILSLILKSWKDKRIEEIRFTMRLMKTR